MCVFDIDAYVYDTYLRVCHDMSLHAYLCAASVRPRLCAYVCVCVCVCVSLIWLLLGRAHVSPVCHVSSLTLLKL